MLVQENCCSLVSCKNHKDYKPGTAYFPLPKNPGLLEKWLSFSGSPKGDLSSFKLCLDHFTPSQFQTTFPKLILKKGAVPSLNGPLQEEKNEVVKKSNNIQCMFGTLLYDDHNYFIQRRPEQMRNEMNNKTVPVSPPKVELQGPKKKAGDDPEEKIKRLEEKLAKQKKLISALRGKIYREKKVKKNIPPTPPPPVEPRRRSTTPKTYTEEEKEVILEIYKLSPTSYGKFAKVLDFPSKQSVKLWSRQQTSKEKSEKPRQFVYRIRSRVSL